MGIVAQNSNQLLSRNIVIRTEQTVASLDNAVSYAQIPAFVYH